MLMVSPSTTKAVPVMSALAILLSKKKMRVKNFIYSEGVSVGKGSAVAYSS